MMDNSIKRNRSIDILRGIGIIIMIMGHVGFGETFSNFKVAFNMPIFFLISGYLHKVRVDKTIVSLRKKAIHLLIPYISFAIITVVFCILVNVTLCIEKYKYVDMLRGVLWGNAGIFPIAGALWFLQCIFWVELFFVFLDLIKKKYIKTALVFFLALVTIVFSRMQINLPFSLDSAFGAVLLYYIGILYKNCELHQKYSFISSPQLWLIIVIFGVGCIGIYFNGPVNPRLCKYGISYFLYVLNAVLITWTLYHTACYIDKHFIRIISNTLEKIGQNSIIYLGMNQIIILCFEVAYRTLFPINSAVEKILRSAVILCLSLITLSLLSKLFLHTKLKVLMGKF